MELKKAKTYYVVLITLASGLSGILYGYDIGVISGAIPLIRSDLALTTSQLGYVIGAVLSGNILSAIVSLPLIDKYGRRKIIAMACGVVLLGIYFVMLSSNYYQLLTGRLLLGIGSGIAAIITPVYLSEIASKNNRGRCVTTFIIFLTAGILFAYIVDTMLAPTGNWKAMFVPIGIFAIIILAVLSFLPESPRWLFKNNKPRLAEKILQNTRSINEAAIDTKNIQYELRSTDIPWLQLISKQLHIPILILITASIFNQTTGINVILQYTPIIIMKSGIHLHLKAMYSTIGIGFVNFICTILSFALVDKVGRKALLSIGLAGVTIALVCLATAHSINIPAPIKTNFVIGSLILFVISFATGPGAVGWVLVSELFPTNARSKAVALCIFLTSIAAALLSTYFLQLLNHIGISGVYLFFACCTITYQLVIWKILPETKGIQLEEINERYAKKLN